MRLPSPSMAVSMTALMVALGGTSYAATKISANSVGSTQIKTNAVGSSEIRSGAVGSSEVKNGSLRAADFGANSLPKGAQGPQGAQGPVGPQGPKGDTGPAGSGRWVLVGLDGTIEAQSGGFSIVSAYGSNGAPAAAAGNVYINAGEPLQNNGLVASIALQNRVNQEGGTMNGVNSDGDDEGTDPDAVPSAGDNLEFSGEIGVSRCDVANASPTNCAPPNTASPNVFVVSPRLSDGQRTSSTNRKRFYVVVAGDSSDRTG